MSRWMIVAAATPTAAGSALTGVALLHGAGLVLCAVLLALVVVVGVSLAVYWVRAMTTNTIAADNWSKWRAAGQPPGPSP